MKTRLPLLLVMFIACSITVKAQSPDPGLLAQGTRDAGTAKIGGGNISSLYSVDNYTGIAGANIPIYSYSINGIDLSVSLSYNANGIKVDERASPVGLGWNINAGGYIVRQVNGVEDERMGGSWQGSYLSSQTPDEKNSDLFIAVFNGRTIKFDIGHLAFANWSIRTYPADANVIITPVTERNCTGCLIPEQGFGNVLSDYVDQNEESIILKFYIRDAQGNTYVFQRGDYEIKSEKKQDNTYKDVYIPLKWNLTKVSTATGLAVNYYYNQKEVKYPAYRSQQVKDVHQDIHWSDHDELANVYVECDSVVEWHGKETYVDHIDYPNGTTVSFVYDDKYDACSYIATTPLSNIAISSKYDNNVKNSTTFNLKHSFFSTPYLTATATALGDIGCTGLYNYFSNATTLDLRRKEQMTYGLRLKLDEITRTGTDGNTEEKAFSFTYNSQGLPRRLNESKDYYGYYNGKVPIQFSSAAMKFNHLSIPVHSVPGGFTYGIDKTPDLTYAKANILTSIRNGEGGLVEFKYKDHTLANPVNGYQDIPSYPNVIFPAYEYENANDGICIDEITVSDGFNKDNTTKTKYEFSDGQRFFKGGFSWYYYGHMGPNSQPYSATGTPEAKVYTNSFVTPMRFVNGANHGYSYAEVKSYGYNNQLLGSTKYHFTNLILHDDPTKSNLCISGDLRYNTFPVNYFYEYRMGKLLDATTHDYNSNPVNRTDYVYTDLLSTDHSVATGTINLMALRSNPNTITAPRNATAYNFYRVPYLLTAKNNITYANTGTLTQSVAYTYNDRLDLKSIAWTDDLLQQNVKNNYYCYEWNAVSYFNIGIVYKTELLKNVNNDWKLVNVSTTEYAGAPFRFKSSNRMMNKELISTSGSPILPMEKTSEATIFDSKWNMLEVKLDDKDIYTSNIWDTRIGKKVASVSNARYIDIAYTSFEGTYAPLGTADDNKGNWDFDNGQVEFAAANAGLKPMTGRYIYGLDGHVIVTKSNLSAGKDFIITCWATKMPKIELTLNVNPQPFPQALPVTDELHLGQWQLYSCKVPGGNGKITISSANSNTFLDELRLYPIDAAMTTTTYEPLWGPNSQCDERGNIRYFEYDVFGRPTIVRDINRNILSVSKQVVRGADN